MRKTKLNQKEYIEFKLMDKYGDCIKIKENNPRKLKEKVKEVFNYKI